LMGHGRVSRRRGGRCRVTPFGDNGPPLLGHAGQGPPKVRTGAG
jgi:hypothetical protein